MERGDPTDQTTIHLLWKWAPGVVGAQSCFDVADRYTVSKRCKGTPQCGCRISLNQDEIGLCLGQNGVQGSEHPRADEIRRLIRPHYLQIMVDSDAKSLGEWVEQRRVLR